jgi:hypothetical protein
MHWAMTRVGRLGLGLPRRRTAPRPSAFLMALEALERRSDPIPSPSFALPEAVAVLHRQHHVVAHSTTEQGQVAPAGPPSVKSYDRKSAKRGRAAFA